MTTDTERCGQVRDYHVDGGPENYPCVLTTGHDDFHRDRDGDQFSDSYVTDAPVAEAGLSDVTGTLAAILDLLKERLPKSAGRPECGTQLSDGPCAGTRRHPGDCTTNADDIPSTQEVPTSSTCPAVLNLGGSKDYPCVLYRGHPGSHLDDDDDHWSITGV